MKFFKKSNSYEQLASGKKAKSPVKKKSIFLKAPLKLLSYIPGSVFVKDVFKNTTLLQKILITILLIVIYRGLASIPLPGIDMNVYREYFGKSTTSEASYLFSIFTGGQLDTPSIVGLGIASFINASIIIQLLTPVIPKLTELSKEGERGRQMITQYTRYLTFVLSLMYSAAYLLLLSKRDFNSSDGITASSNPVYLIPRLAGANWPSMEKIIFMTLVLAAGSLFVMWLSELITEYGLGNGSSIIISIGIISSLPALIRNDLARINFSSLLSDVLKGNFNVLWEEKNFLWFVVVIVGFILMTLAIIFISESIRQIPVQYARRVRGEEGGKGSNLPLKLTLTGVMPLIFASALLTMPQLISPLLTKAFGSSSQIISIQNWLDGSFFFANRDQVVDNKDILFALVDFLLIIAFGIFYAFIVFKPDETAENLQKSGAFIPGVRPGIQTQNYVSDVLIKIAFAGSLFLGVIGLIPTVSRNIIQATSGVSIFLLSGIAGTSILIAVSVVIDTVRQYNSLKVTKSYEKYVK